MLLIQFLLLHLLPKVSSEGEDVPEFGEKNKTDVLVLAGKPRERPNRTSMKTLSKAAKVAALAAERTVKKEY